jgi:hypothetical protein
MSDDIAETARASAEEFARMNPSLASLAKVMEYQLAAVIKTERERLTKVSVDAAAAAISGAILDEREQCASRLDQLAAAIRRGEA